MSCDVDEVKERLENELCKYLINKISVFKLIDNAYQMLFFLIVTSLHHLPIIMPHTHIVASSY